MAQRGNVDNGQLLLLAELSELESARHALATRIASINTQLKTEEQAPVGSEPAYHTFNTVPDGTVPPRHGLRHRMDLRRFSP